MPSPSNTDNEVETRIDVIVKHPEVILLEDQHNSNSNCLVLDVRSRPKAETIVEILHDVLAGVANAYDQRRRRHEVVLVAEGIDCLQFELRRTARLEELRFTDQIPRKKDNSRLLCTSVPVDLATCESRCGDDFGQATAEDRRAHPRHQRQHRASGSEDAHRRDQLVGNTAGA